MSNANVTGLMAGTGSRRPEAVRWKNDTLADEPDRDPLSAPRGILVGLGFMLLMWLAVAACVCFVTIR